MRYWLYNKPVNMRMDFNGLSGIVNNSMGMSMRSLLFRIRRIRHFLFKFLNTLS